MSGAHFIYIPAVLIAGVVIGFILGARAARESYEVERRRQEARRARAEAAGRSEGPT